MDIHTAAANGNLEEIKCLIKNEINIYKTNENNDTALSIALAYKQKDVAIELLSVYQKDLALIEKDYKGAIHIAISDDEIEYILNWNSRDKVGSPVKVYLKNKHEFKDIYISTKDDLKILIGLSDNGLIDVNIENVRDKTLLDLAVDFGNVEIVTKLLDLGATNLSFRMFELAVRDRGFEIVEQLLKYIPYRKLNPSDDDFLILQPAAESGNAEVFSVILELLADLEMQKIKTKNIEAARSQFIKNVLETKSGQYSPTTVLHLLIESKCFKLVTEYLLKYKPNLNIANNDFMCASLLDCAIMANNLELVKQLIDEGMDVLKNYRDVPSEYFSNALVMASRDGDFEIFEEIVKHCPSEIFKEGTHGSVEALCRCLQHGYKDSMKKAKLLINSGMNLKSHPEGGTYLLEATWSDNFEIVKLIVDNLETDPETGKCIHLDTLSSTGNSPIDYTVRLFAKREIFDYLLGLGANLNSADQYGWSPLHFASRFGHHDIVKIMLEHGADTSLVNDKGDKPIQSALKSGNYETFKLYFNSDVDLEMRNKSGNTLLILAAKFNTLEAVNEILKAGGDIHAVNYAGQTALHFAWEYETIKALIDNGANPLARDKEGNTPYLFSSFDSSWKIEQFRNHLKFDIDYSLRNNDNANMLHYILHSGKECVVNFPEIFEEEKFNCLFEDSSLNGAGQSSFWLASCHEGMPFEVIKRIVENSNPDLNARPDPVRSNGEVAVHCLIRNRSLEILDYVLEKGADVEILSKEGQKTPIIAGVECPKIVQILVKHGANVNAQDENGSTALHKAAETGSLQSAKILLATGADLKIVDKNKKTALEYCSNSTMTELLTLFL